MSNPAYQQVTKVIVENAGNLSEAEKKALKGLLDGLNDQPQLSFPSYTVSINYDQTIEQMIRTGRFNWFDDDIISRYFTSNEKGVTEILVYLVNFNRNISSEDAVKGLDRRLRLATLKELLALGIAHPDLQRHNPIVALGSTWRGSSGDVETPFLYGGAGSRYLDLAYWNGVWPSEWRFAAVQVF